MFRQWIVCDLDGTLCNCQHRRSHIQKNPKDWDAFHDALHLDTIYEDVEEMLRLYSQDGYMLAFCTGRPVRYWEQTRKWLARYSLTHHALLMRGRNDYRAATIVKPELLFGIGITPENTSIILEDDARLVDTWRAIGFTCYHVRPGLGT